MSDSIPRVTGKVFSRKFTMLGRLLSSWDEIMGQDLANKTQPVKLRYFKAKIKSQKAKATLDIATSPADATILHYQKDLILERINQIFGEQWVTDIKFVPKASNDRPGSARNNGTSGARGVSAPSSLSQSRKMQKSLTVQEKELLLDLLHDIDDPDLRKRLESLGSAILKDQK